MRGQRVAFACAAVVALGTQVVRADPGPYIPCEGHTLGSDCMRQANGGICVENPSDPGCFSESPLPQFCLMCVTAPEKGCESKQSGDVCGKETSVCVEKSGAVCSDDASTCLHCEDHPELLCEGKSQNDECGSYGVCILSDPAAPDSTLVCLWSGVRSCTGKQPGQACGEEQGLTGRACQQVEVDGKSYFTCEAISSPVDAGGDVQDSGGEGPGGPPAGAADDNGGCSCSAGRAARPGPLLWVLMLAAMLSRAWKRARADLDVVVDD